MLKRRSLLILGLALILALFIGVILVKASPSVTKVYESLITSSAYAVPVPYGALNGASYQTEGITTYNGWQYAVYYKSTADAPTGHRHVAIARRQLPAGAWQELEFTDYDQTADDGHNIISMGISPIDGTIHLAFDMHGNVLHYRKSVSSLATNPGDYSWTASNFGSVQDNLDGTQIAQVTYPRFVITPTNKLLFDYRSGSSGSGQENLYEYDGSTGTWTSLGKYIDNPNGGNAYINGLTFDKNGRLHVTFTWRDTGDTMTNHDIFYIYSDDYGRTWKNNAGTAVGTTGTTFVTDQTSGVKIWTIGTNRGLSNQESQNADNQGRIHLLLSHMQSSEPDAPDWNTARKKSYFFQYWRGSDGVWHETMVPNEISKGRGKIAFDSSDNAYAIVPAMKIYSASAANNWTDWGPAEMQDNGRFTGEPIFDNSRIKYDGILSVFYQEKNSANIYVLDYNTHIKTYNPTNDAYVRGGTYASTNYGSEVTLMVKNDSSSDYLRKSYFTFDFSTYSGISVNSAKLRYCVAYTGSDATRTVKVYGVTDESWQEGSITWNNAPAGSTYITETNISYTTSGVWYEPDVTSYVNSHLADKKVSFLLIIEGTPSGESTVGINSKDASNYKPELVITNNTPAPGPTPTPVPETLLYVTTADAYVRDGSSANTNFGTNVDLMVRTDVTGSNQKSYITFDFGTFSGVGTNSAKLNVCVAYKGADASRTIKLYGVTDESWQENSITWNNVPTGTQFITEKIISSTGWYEFDVSEYANAHMEDKKVSFLLVNEGTASSGSYIGIKSNNPASTPPPDYRPYMKIFNGIATPMPVTMTDDLNDWTKVQTYSSGLVFDTANATVLEDGSRAKRNNTNASPVEYVVYNYNKISKFVAATLFAPEEGKVDFKFYTSPDGVSWAQHTNWFSDYDLPNSTWTRRTYTVNGIEPGTNYVKMEWRTGGSYSYNPQLGKVEVNYVPKTVDDLDDWTKVYSHSSGLVFDTANATILEDGSRAKRNNTNASPAENVVYNYSAIYQASAVALFAPEEAIVDFGFYSSPNGTDWTHIYTTSSDYDLPNSTWTRRTYTMNAIPTGTNYIKIEWRTGGSYSYNPQLGKVEIIHQ